MSAAFVYVLRRPGRCKIGSSEGHAIFRQRLIAMEKSYDASRRAGGAP